MDELDRWREEAAAAEKEIAQEIARGILSRDTISPGFWFNLEAYMLCNVVGHSPDGPLIADENRLRATCARCGIGMVANFKG